MEVIDDFVKSGLIFSGGAEPFFGVGLRDNGRETTLLRNFFAKDSK